MSKRAHAAAPVSETKNRIGELTNTALYWKFLLASGAPGTHPSTTSTMLTLLSLGTAGHLVAPRSLALATSPRAAVSMVAAERGTSAKEELLSLSQEGLKPMDDGAQVVRL